MNLHRKRAAAFAVLILALGVSVAANVGHAQDNWPSRLIAAWPPLALLLAIEGVLAIPMDKWWGWLRRFATILVAAVAAVLSYGHMRAVAEMYGEGEAAWLWPLAVDGLVVVASVCLVELSGRIRAEQAKETPPVAKATAGRIRKPRAAAADSHLSVPQRPTEVTRSQQPAYRQTIAEAVREARVELGDNPEAITARVKKLFPDRAVSEDTVRRTLNRERTNGHAPVGG